MCGGFGKNCRSDGRKAAQIRILGANKTPNLRSLILELQSPVTGLEPIAGI
jgi:hypothetical protein